MGDISEMRGLITVATIVSVTVALVLLMPSEMYATTYDQDLTTNPAANDLSELLGWNSTYAWNITAGAEQTTDINGYHYLLYTQNIFDNTLQLETYDGWWVFRWNFDRFKWYNWTSHADVSSVDILNRPYLNLTKLDDWDVLPVKLGAENSKCEIAISFAYDNTTYTGYIDAFDNNALTMVFNLDFSDRATSINAFELIGMVLFGALPNIDPVLSGIFAFIGWGIAAAVAYLMFIFTLRVIGAVFGGGGA